MGEQVGHPLKKLNLTLALFCMLAASNFCEATTVMGEQCDWTGSGLDWTGGVRPVYLRCQQGRISWSYPRAALRVLLRLGSTGRDFKGCIRANASRLSGATIYLEGEDSLKRLNTAHQTPTCFLSKGGLAALYVEAEAPTTVPIFPKFLAQFSYDLEALSKHPYDSFDECRPCSNEEISRAYCTSDLVGRGTIERVEVDPNQEIEFARVKVKMDRVLRHSFGSLEDVPDRENEVDDSVSTSLHVATRCQPKPGLGEYVFMARKKLGSMSLVCATRIDHWKQIVRREMKLFTSHCELSY